jgi:tetratricopeptide (TPR) repeat protein
VAASREKRKIMDTPQESARRPEDAFVRAARLHRAGHLGEAAEAYRTILARNPDDARAWSNLGITLRARGAASSAIACYRRAIALSAAPATLGNLGNALKDAGRYEEAIAAHRACVAVSGEDPRARHNYAIALKAAGRLDDALAELEIACRLDPSAAGPQWDRALILLGLGRYAEGWPAYESRWRLENRPHPYHAAHPWDGSPFSGRTLLVYPEQGFGDAILTARFLSGARSRGGRVVLACKRELRRLFSDLSGVDRLVAADVAVEADLVVPAMSLPGLLDARLEWLPPPPRLHVPANASARFQPLLAPWSDRFKVGIVWSGSVTFKGNSERATTLEPFLRLAEIDGVQLFSLQKGPPAAQLAESGADGSVVVDLARHAADFADTAAIVSLLDLVIMTDSAVAHLAGALGRPVWNLLNLVPYWLYLRDREDTPWYPSMRLFRQRRHGDWAEVFARVAAALADAAAAKTQGRWPG